MSASLQWSGLDALHDAVQALPEVFRAEAGTVIGMAARAHHASMLAHFPAAGRDVTGNLRRGTGVWQESPLTWRVRNAAPHAHLYEFGYRHIASGREVPGQHAWVPRAQIARERMVSDLVRVLERAATRTGALQVMGGVA